MFVFKKTTLIATLCSIVFFGLSACGGDNPSSDADKAEEIRGVVKDIGSQTKETAIDVASKTKEAVTDAASKVTETASDVASKAKESATNAVEQLEGKIKVPSISDSE